VICAQTKVERKNGEKSARLEGVGNNLGQARGQTKTIRGSKGLRAVENLNIVFPRQKKLID